jgi:tetratricopeptide (TPR) repeat protein
MVLSRRWTWLFAGLFVLAATGRATAQHRQDPEAVAKEKDAREHYNKGILHYDLGEIDAAITEFRQAYAISAAHGLLFNIAQAYRMKKDYEQALYFYRTYLRLQPHAANRKDVEARVEEMEQLVKEQTHVTNERPHGVIPPGQKNPDEQHITIPIGEPPPPPVGAVEQPPAQNAEGTPPAAPVTAAPKKPFFGSPQRIAGAAVLGVGVVSLILTAALGGSALAAHSDYNKGCDLGACNDATYDRAHGLAIGSDVMLGIGVAAVAAGVILLAVKPKEAARTVAFGNGVRF